ncbi:hypothetical protein [Aureispira anguillae]|uniref:DUF3299 domain-containing protein n=1 Tax=Aureispira anguillae TaxID=2864201 RepID=A0A916DVK2_9BACT|nr:hypothetical protein [Aureispira anguillae]BDS13211.1 hypothetical protein AsAng_0039400 [Aureispira anguillae]
MKKILLLLTVVFAYSIQINAQKKKTVVNYWENMMDVTVKSKFDPVTENFTNTPTFGKKILKLDGKKIHLKGFIIPADLTKGRMTLSKFSYSSCYFCGAAGPESVIEIVAKNPIIYRMDKPIVLEGTLRINRTTNDQEYDPFRLLYILEDATYYSED